MPTKAGSNDLPPSSQHEQPTRAANVGNQQTWAVNKRAQPVVGQFECHPPTQGSGSRITRPEQPDATHSGLPIDTLPAGADAGLLKAAGIRGLFRS